MQLTSKKSIIKDLGNQNIRYQEVHSYTDKAPNVTSLLKPLIKVGAQSTTQDSLRIGEWRRLSKAWPISSTDNSVTLTWLIQILIIQR